MPGSRATRRPTFDDWADALIARHLGAFTRPEFLRAARALSARYVEGRHNLSSRSALDSAGKRAAFAVLYGPQHFATTRAIVQALGLGTRRTQLIVDLGCGTGAASAGWATALHRPPTLHGVDRDAWALTEADWTWRTLGFEGRTRRGDLTVGAGRLLARGPRLQPDTAILSAYAANELSADARASLLAHLVGLGQRSVTVLVIEPVSGRTAPWWSDWARTIQRAGGRADEWRLPNTLPEALRRLDRDAGFDRPELTGRSLALIPDP